MHFRFLRSKSFFCFTVLLFFTHAFFYNEASANDIVTFSSLKAQVTPLSLDEAIALAIRNNRGIQTAYLQRVAQKFDLYVAEGKFLPKLTLTGNLTRSYSGSISSSINEITTATTLSLSTGATVAATTSTGLNVGAGNPYSASLSITQPLLKNGGFNTNFSSVYIARLDDQINRLVLKNNLSQIITQVIYAYRELLRVQDQKIIAVAALQRGKELYAINEALIAAGRMAESEIIQTQADVANLELSLIEADNQIDSARLALSTLLAIESNAQIVAAGLHNIHLQGVDLAQALETALENQLDYRIALLEVEKSKINLDYAKNQQYWDISLVAGRSQSRSSQSSLVGSDSLLPQSQNNNSSYAGVQLKVPLGDRSIEQILVQASVNLRNINIRVADVKQVVEQRIRDAVRNVHIRWRQYELTGKVSELSTMKLNAEREKLRVGRSSNFQVLAFENDLRNAENAKINAEISYLNALTDLDERMGKVIDTWKIPIVEKDLELSIDGY